jgi:TPP-dependent pyruvate/acetoin dehydrogenase alpha subunit
MKNKNIALYQTMYLIRTCEEKIRAYYPSDKIKTPVHLSIGQEAIVTGVIHELKSEDQVFGTYRNHGIYLAKSGNTDSFFGEMFGRVSGEFKGKAGSMHLSSPENGFMGSSAIVATTIPLSLGCAFVNQQKKNGRLTAVFFGDGATDEGVFWESLNFACLKKIPLMFICEDNGLAIHSKTSERQGYRSITNIVNQFDCHVIKSQSTDPEVIADLTAKGISHIYKNSGPVFFHFKYYRYLEHVGINEDFESGYRSRKEFKRWNKVDPISLQRAKLIKYGLKEIFIQEIENKILEKIEKSIALASKAPFPPETDLYQDVYA